MHLTTPLVLSILCTVAVFGQAGYPSGASWLDPRIDSQWQVQLGIFCKIASNESGNYTFTFNHAVSGLGVGAMLSISGGPSTCSGLSSFDGSSTKTGNGSSNAVGSFSVGNGSDLLVYLAAVGAGAAITVPTGYYGQMIATNNGLTIGTINYGYPGIGGTVPAMTYYNSGTAVPYNAVTNDKAVMALAIPSAFQISPNNAAIQGYPSIFSDLYVTNNINTGGFVSANGFLLSTPPASGNTNCPGTTTSTTSYAYALCAASTHGAAIPLINVNTSNNIQIGGDNTPNIVQIGNTNFGGATLLIGSGIIEFISRDASQDLYVAQLDSSDNLKFGNDTQSGASEENNMIFAVQTGKEFLWTVNAVNMMVMNAGPLAGILLSLPLRWSART